MTLSEDSGPSVNRSTVDDTFKILLATDIHLGYNETDKVTGEINSFIQKRRKFHNFFLKFH